MAAQHGKTGKRKLTASAGAAPVGFATGIETEVKLETTAEGLQLAVDWPPLGGGTPTTTQVLRSLYFDTNRRDLLAGGIVLRVRKADDAQPVLAIKQPANDRGRLFHRHEYQAPMRAMLPALDLMEPAVAASLLSVTAERPLEIQFETQVTRRTRTIAHEGAEIEVAFDHGRVVLPDGKERGFHEVELELKSGDAASLFDVARAAAAAT